MTNSSRHSTLLSAQSGLRVLRASKRLAFPPPRPFCPTAFLSTGLLVLDSWTTMDRADCLFESSSWSLNQLQRRRGGRTWIYVSVERRQDDVWRSWLRAATVATGVQKSDIHTYYTFGGKFANFNEFYNGYYMYGTTMVKNREHLKFWQYFKVLWVGCSKSPLN